MRRALAGLLVVLGTLLALPAAAAAAPINPDDMQPVLPSGHCMLAQRDYPSVELRSRSGRVELYLNRNAQLELDDHVEVAGSGGEGYPIWFAVDPRGTAKQATLCMQRDGDLVLRRDGHALWHTHTAGKAVHGVARVLDSGALVVRTTHNTTVWSSHTTTVLMVARDRLAPGHALVNRTYPHSWTTLRMRRTGDLVLLHNGRVVWHTGTYIRGSYLLVTKAGRIDILTPQHRVIWRSHAVGRATVFTVAQQGRITLLNQNSRHCWQRPANRSVDCQAG